MSSVDDDEDPSFTQLPRRKSVNIRDSANVDAPTSESHTGTGKKKATTISNAFYSLEELMTTETDPEL
jgi:hypothetical protein